MITLESPSVRLHSAFLDMARDFQDHGNARYVRDAEDFAVFLGRCRDEEEGRVAVPAGVPVSSFWLVEDDRILGSSRLRHRLTPELDREGGNIGYDIRPSERRRGFATLLLRLTLGRAAILGLERARITCDADNIGSIRVIEKNGGVLEDEVPSDERAVMIRRYWIACGGQGVDR